MRLVVVVLALLLLAALVHSQSAWRSVRRSSGDTALKFTVALSQHRLDELEAMYWRTSDPRSPEYAQWKTLDELNALVAPPPHAISRVTRWLARAGITDVESYGDFLVVKTVVSAAERLLHMQFHDYEHETIAWTITRFEGAYVLPRELSRVIDFISGVNDFPLVHDSITKQTEAAVPTTDYYVVPQSLRALYNVSTSLRATNPQSTQAVVEFSPSAGISFQDLASFSKLTDTPITNISYIVGDFEFNPSNPANGESTLDYQYITSIAMGANSSFWVVNGWLYDFTTLVQQRVAQKLPVPWVFSISYGWAESQQCVIANCSQLGNTPQAYVTRTNTEFQKIGLLGITLIGISQDSGAASKYNRLCNKTPAVNPEYPGASPYIFVLGATMLDPASLMTDNRPPFCVDINTPCAIGGEEVVCSVPVALITSGGGFSNYAARPSYQDSAVATWAANANALRPPPSEYNANGRGYPDISTLGHHYLIVLNGQSIAVDGTSASAPVFAGMATLLNDARFNANKAPLGPLNTLFYQIAAANFDLYFNDITVGNNTGTMSSLFYPHGCYIPYGYGAVKGWDPVSGLGSPNFGNILDYINALKN